METSQKQRDWTINSLQEWCTSFLKEKDFESPRLNTDLLLCHALQCQRIELYTNFDKPLAVKELEKFRSLFNRRLNHEPVQYITDEAHFMGLTLYVDKRVLIPRPETETLVEEAVKQLKTDAAIQARILDIGTGSGNIPISIARLIPDSIVESIDVSDDALNVARINVKKHHFEERITLSKLNILTDSQSLQENTYEMIISNPPYVSQKEFLELPPDVKNHEPSLATTDNSDGLTFYRAISNAGQRILKQNGWLFFEVGYDQSPSVKSILEQGGYYNIESIADFNKFERIVKAQKLSA